MSKKKAEKAEVEVQVIDVTPDLGMEVRDIISGFRGIVTARSEFLNGCERIFVEPSQTKDGAMVDSVWFDTQQLEVISTATKARKLVEARREAGAKPVATQAVGGPRPDAKRRPDCPR